MHDDGEARSDRVIERELEVKLLRAHAQWRRYIPVSGVFESHVRIDDHLEARCHNRTA